MRIQLSMYVPESAAAALERARATLDPVQHRLIPAHVTLCRDDEASALDPDDITSRLADVHARAVTLEFGAPQVFDGHGILLPCTGGEETFHALRRHVLGSRPARRLAPHITLAHPRNPRAASNSLAHAAGLPEPLSITFASVCLIDQMGGGPWHVRQPFTLRTPRP